MSETILTYDEEESRRETERQMQRTAAMNGFGDRYFAGLPDSQSTQGPPPVTYVRPDVLPQLPFINQQTPMQPPLIVAAQIADHLLITPAGRPGLVRLIRMQGSEKRSSWTVAESVVETFIAILVSFGISLTDLREEEPDVA